MEVLLLSQSEHNNGGLQKEIRHLTALWGIAQHHSFSVVKFLDPRVKRPEWISFAQKTLLLSVHWRNS